MKKIIIAAIIFLLIGLAAKPVYNFIDYQLMNYRIERLSEELFDD